MKKLWILFIAIFVFSFSVLLWIGSEIFREAPPIPDQVVTTDGTILVPAGDILNGQNVWQAMGGMQVGSIWGHGSYVAPDWTADYLHREALFTLNQWSNGQYGKDGATLSGDQKAVLQQRLQELMRKNTYEPSSGKLVLDPAHPCNHRFCSRLRTDRCAWHDPCRSRRSR